MTTLNAVNRDMLYSLSWYMSARKTALRSALSFRMPLSVQEAMDMRVHYSGYFLNLVAAIDLIRDTTTLSSGNFKSLLYSRLVCDGFQDGEANYFYIRELRNAVVHRGLDITSDQHFDGDFPMILAPLEVQNHARTKTFATFGKYLLHVIEKCESVVGSVMFDCLKAAGIFDATIDTLAAAAEYRAAIQSSSSMPENVKANLLASEFKPEWAEAAHDAEMMKLRAALSPCRTMP